ncbi:endo-1,4-beta-xylanase 5-like [Corylus avellana]|uniref:endo-1,4-beta-xylanase 5-like n=1 Tax=Corylus avellana TaxID=13451 RepID=UPI00286C1D0B|nr:endo-1,4-beta-xylanase 5-like [Corylus avellana]
MVKNTQFTGQRLEANALKYDHAASAKCLLNPHKAQYGGGIIKNPELNKGLKGWSTFGNAKIEQRVSRGNQFIVAHTRTHPHDSISQKLFLEKDKLYTLSAWLQVSNGNVDVTAVFKTNTGFKHAGAVTAKTNCWSMLKTGFTVNASSPAELYFESENASVDIWVDSISLQPFTKEQWKSHQVESIEKTRKRKVRIHAVDEQGNPMSNATVSFEQKKLSFPFGTAINKNILTNTDYQNWFTSRPFTVTVFENEMKWYANEPSQGEEKYDDADALLQFAQQLGIDVRGHTVLWEDPQMIQGWVSSLSSSELSVAVNKRIKSVMSKYKGQVIAWDVVNENMHHSFFEDKLGSSASASFYKRAQTIDGTTPLFLNEYNTIEDSRDGSSKPNKYLQKLEEIQGFHGNNNLEMGIGLQGHFSYPPDLSYIRASLDTLASKGLSIWITELDVKNSTQAQYLEQVLWELHAHPSVNGIMLWTAWSPGGCYRMCLTDNNFNNLATGDVVDKLMQKWGSKAMVGTTDADGVFEASLFHGDYQVKISHPKVASSNLGQSFVVSSASKDTSEQPTLVVQVSA